MHDILKRLEGGDLRSKADEIAEEISGNSELFEEVFEGLFNDDPVVRMRSADALEKASRRNRSLLEPLKERLINEASKIKQKEVQWHVAQMLSYIYLTENELEQVIKILDEYLESDSRIVVVNSLQTLTELAAVNEKIRPIAITQIGSLMKTGAPSIVSRGKKLLKRLK